MADRTVSVRLQAVVTDYMTKMSAAGKATEDLARKVEVAKGRSAQGYHMIGVAGVAMGAAVAGGLALAIKASADFEAKMALVRTLAHASSAEMQQLAGAALHVGQAYGFSATQVADAEAELVKAGVSVKDMMGGALTGALTLASAGQTDVATATTIAATAMTQFALKGKDVPHIADLLAAGADKALGSVTDLGYALDMAGPQAHQFHVSLEETVGTLAAFAQAGQIGERGGTVFSQMLLKLAAPSAKASGILTKLGISIYNTNGDFVGMANLAGQLQTKMGGLTQAQRNTDLAIIFGQRAIRGANILYQEGAQGIADWTDKVNAQGFASLQASGKLNSLSGDVTKLKTALQTAFIGVGSGAQGPLRTMVQDVTKAVEVWSGLPGPVRDAAEALVLAGGAISLVGGAALLFIPKWAAMNVALKESGMNAISAKGALAGLGKATVVGAAILGLYEGAKALGHALAYNTTPSVNDFTTALVDLSHAATPAASALGGYIHALSGLAGTDAAGMLPTLTKNLDAALANLVTGGHLATATGDFADISRQMRAAGMTTAQITALFPQFASALNNSATSAKVAGNGVDQYGNAVGAAAQATKKATDAAKHYSDVLHALTDPLFAMNQALGSLTTAQHAASKATRKYGADSKEARQANLDLASASLDVETAARTLASSVNGGTTSLSAARKMLRGWVKDGLVTQAQAKVIASSFQGLIKTADHLAKSGHAAGKAAGMDFGNGMVVGLQDSTGPVEAAAAKLAMSAAASVRKHHKSKSPSLVGKKLGIDFGDGIALGIDASTLKVEEAALRQAQAAVRVTEREFGRVQSRLSTARSNAASLSSGISSNLSGAFDLSNAPNLSAKGITSFLGYGAKATERFDRLERKLIREGYDPTVVQQIAAMGVGPGTAAALNLSRAPQWQRDRINRLEDRIGHASSDVGAAAAQQQFGDQISRLTTRLDTIRGELHDLKTTVKDLGRQVHHAQHTSASRSS